LSDERLKQEIWKRFTKEQVIFVATSEGDQPRVRPVTLVPLNDRLYVTTGTNDAKVKQLVQNPRSEFCLLLEEGGHKGSLRVECLTRIVDDPDTKANVYHNVSFADEFWSGPEDPTYTLIEFKPIAFEYMKPNTIESIRVKP